MRLAALTTVGSQNSRPTDAMDPMESLGKTSVYHRGEEIYRREDPARHWYRVASGMARKSALLADGRRQIVDFLLPGDFFGLVARHEHFFAVEAVIESTVVVRYPRRSVELLADANPPVGQRIRAGWRSMRYPARKRGCSSSGAGAPRRRWLASSSRWRSARRTEART